MKILFVPDIHLGKSTNIGKDIPEKGINSRIEDQQNLLNFTLDKAKENNVNRIILLGDIWENANPKTDLVVIFLEWLKKCIDNNICIDVIQGNHDLIKVGNVYKSMLDIIPAIDFPNCSLYKNIETKVYDNIKITYLPYTNRKLLEVKTITEAYDKLGYLINNSFNSKPNCDINIIAGHIAVEKSIWIGDEIDEDSSELLCPVSMFANYDISLFGHIHKPQLMSENPFVMHIGSLDKTSFGEDNKFLFIVDEEGGLKKVKLPTRNLLEFIIKIPEDIDNETNYIKNYIKEQHKKNSISDAIVRIKVENNNPNPTIDRVNINNFLNELKIHNLCSFNEVPKIKSVEIKNDIDESMNHYEAVNVFIDGLSFDEQFKSELKEYSKDIIKEVKST